MNIPRSEYTNSLKKATVIIAVFSLLAKIVGLARDAVFSHQFGTGVIIDAYFAAFRIPDFIFNLLILGTFSVAFIPVYSEYLVKDKKNADKLGSSIINFTLVAILLLSVLALIFINQLVDLIAPGFTGEARELTKLFTRIFLLSPIFLTASSIVSSILNSHKKFALVSAAPVIYNLSIILGVVFLYPKFGPAGLAMGVVLGAFLHFIIQIPQLFSVGFKYSFIIDWTDLGFIKFWKLYWPRIFSMGSNQVTLLVASLFGSFLGAGSLSAFYYANNLQSVFLSLFAVSLAIAVFPLLSDLFNLKNENGFKDILAKTTIQILYFIVPLSILMLVLRAQIVRLILGIGQNTNFSFESTRLVSLTFGLFAISLFAQALIPLYARAFYARQNTVIPVIIGIITIIFNVFATYFFITKMGMPGMAVAFSLSSILNLILLIGELHHKIGTFHDEYLIINSFKIVISSMFAGLGTFIFLYLVAPWVNMQTYLGIFIQATVSGSIGVLIYLGFSRALNMEEAKDLLKLVKNIYSKITRPINEIWNML